MAAFRQVLSSENMALKALIKINQRIKFLAKKSYFFGQTSSHKVILITLHSTGKLDGVLCSEPQWK